MSTIVPVRERNTDSVAATIATGSFRTLATALAAADLVDTLKGTGPYHVVPGRVTARGVAKLTSATTASGKDLSISAGDEVRINDAQVLSTDIPASNGVIHVVDRVLLPR